MIFSEVAVLTVLSKNKNWSSGDSPGGAIRVVRTHIGGLFHGEKNPVHFGLSLLYS